MKLNVKYNLVTKHLLTIITLFVLNFFAKAQNDIVYKNLAASLNRDVNKSYSLKGQNNNFYDLVYFQFNGNDDFNRSLAKLKLDSTQVFDKKAILITNTLNYFFDSFVLDYLVLYNETDFIAFSDSLCPCLKKYDYQSKNDEAKNMIYIKCMENYFKDKDAVAKVKDFYIKNNTGFNGRKKELFTSILLCKYCATYREFYINRVVAVNK